MQKKAIGYALIAVGLALLAFTLYTYFMGRSHLISPVPDDRGVKVIYK
jgi:hypothetical protein